jgi:hypothetical protein
MARRTDLHLDPPAWLSASLVAFVVAGLLTFVVSRPRHAADRREAPVAVPAGAAATSEA